MDWKSYFHFTRKDLKGIFSLVVILILLLLGPLLLHLLLSGGPVAISYGDIRVNGRRLDDSLVTYTNGDPASGRSKPAGQSASGSGPRAYRESATITLPAGKGKAESGLRISLNRATYDEFRKLRDLPYGNIRDIIRYRERNGNFTSVGEVKNSGLVDEQTFARIKPYLNL